MISIVLRYTANYSTKLGKTEKKFEAVDNLSADQRVITFYRTTAQIIITVC